MWVIGDSELLSTRILVDAAELTTGTVDIYVSFAVAGVDTYLDTDGTSTTTTRTAWQTGITHDADEGFGAYLTVPAALTGHTAYIEYQHSQLGYVNDEQHYVTENDLDDVQDATSDPGASVEA